MSYKEVEIIRDMWPNLEIKNWEEMGKEEGIERSEDKNEIK